MAWYATQEMINMSLLGDFERFSPKHIKIYINIV